MKETVVWNVEKGLSMTIDEYADACRRHSRIFARIGEFMSPLSGRLRLPGVSR